MASFVAVIDPNIARRDAFLQAAGKTLSPIPGLQDGALEVGDFGLIWTAFPGAPINVGTTASSAAVVFGTAILPDSDQSIEAADLIRLWEPSDISSAICPFDGFHAALRYNLNHGLLVGVDLLGMFPIYWWHDQDVTVVSSCPDMFRLHPNFSVRLDMAGLAGILASMHLIGGKTLLQGIRRLAAGHLLLAKPGQSPKEILQYKMPVSNEYFDLPFSAHVDLLNETMARTMQRHTRASRATGMLLSGGLDSRLLAGYMSTQSGKINTLTFGAKTDYEVEFATLVAKQQGFGHIVVPSTPSQPEWCAETHATQTHIASGFNSPEYWGVHAHLKNLGPAFVAGYALDALIGTHWSWPYDGIKRTFHFDTLYTRLNGYGVPENILGDLLSPNFDHSLVQDIKEVIRSTYLSFPGDGYQRGMGFELFNRQRYHVGRIAWMMSFGSWPVLPALDQALIKLAGSIPFSSWSERLAEEQLVRRYFPKLAEIGLDRNSDDTTPLSPRIRNIVAHAARHKLIDLASKLGIKHKQVERRYYHQLYDINSPAWQRVRVRAESGRDKMEALFASHALRRYLPPPGDTIASNRPVLEFSGRKILIGLMLWGKKYL
ncbi:MAG: asparagine synthase-related protein [Burkholderiales bacterium]